MTILFTHAACLDHDTGPGHPECAARLRAVLAALEDEEFASLEREEAPQASEAHLLLAHSHRHIEAIRQRLPHSGYSALDPDTVLSPGSWDAAMRAAGAAVAAVDRVMEGKARNAFCAVRPPGHHAESAHAMGFCLFNNAAIAALHARAAHEAARVAILDFDVHHGNGTQEILEDDAGFFYASTHQWGAYPGTGAAQERGVSGNVVNVPLAPGSGSAEWRKVMEQILLPRLAAFVPDLIVISAGFDAHRADPLAGLRFETGDYGWGTAEICAVADKVCSGRIVSLLEGGYDLTALAQSTAAHVRALLAAA